MLIYQRVPLIEAADRACFVLEVLFRVLGQRPGLEDLQNVWKALRLALLFQDPGAAALVPVLLPLLWPYFTATLEHDTRNSYVTFRAFPNRLRQRLFDGLHGCLMLLEQLDPVEHLHVSPHLAEAMLVVEDMLAVVMTADPAPMWWLVITGALLVGFVRVRVRWRMRMTFFMRVHHVRINLILFCDSGKAVSVSRAAQCTSEVRSWITWWSGIWHVCFPGCAAADMTWVIQVVSNMSWYVCFSSCTAGDMTWVMQVNSNMSWHVCFAAWTASGDARWHSRVKRLASHRAKRTQWLACRCVSDQVECQKICQY